MLEFWAGAAALLLLAAVFLFCPQWFLRSGRRSSLKQDNLEWYKLRQQELSEEEVAQPLLEDAGLRLLEDDVDQLVDTETTESEGRLLWLWLLLVILASVLYLQLGAAEDVRLSQSIQSMGEDIEPDEVHAIMAQIAARSEQRPGNLHYQAMLGRYYMSTEDYSQARDVYFTLVEATPDDPTALALAAQASFLANDRVLDPQTQVLAERALNQNPHERSALGLLGMVAFERQQYRAAIGYWQRLLAIEQPGSPGAKLIEDVIGRAQLALAENGASSDSETVDSLGAHLKVRVELPAGAQVDPNAVVFVFARNAASESRMPVAVKRYTANQLPLELTLDDAASMAGQKISVLEGVMLVARISRDGQPGEASAIWQGQAGPLQPSADAPRSTLVLQSTQP